MQDSTQSQGTSQDINAPPTLESADPTTAATLDDIFVSSHSLSPSHEPSDTARLRSIHVTAGYRDGISEARSAAVQEGFDQGYLLGAAVGARVGLLLGLADGVCAAVGGSSAGADVDANAVERVGALRDAMRRDLAMDSVLGPRYVMRDGTWGWDVDEERLEAEGVAAVAEEHPLIRWYASIMGVWVKVLGLRRPGERHARDDDGE